MVELKSISILDENMKECIALEVFPEQAEFVASNAVSLAQAYDENRAYAKTGKGNIAVPYAVYKNSSMVGFVMYGYFPPEDGDNSYCTDEHYYYVWRLFVDKNHQGRGIGREVLRLIMDEIKSKPCGEASHCYSSYVASNIASKTTFASYGFEEDGRVLDGEVVARYRI